MNSRLRDASLVMLPPLILFLLHAGFYRSYGIFRDEYYYYVCGQRPAWGYVDHPPLVGWISYVLSHVFHLDLPFYRFWSFAAAAAHLALVLAWVRRRGGGALALTLVSVALIVAPVRLGIDHFFSMNSLEPLLWFGIFWLFAELHALSPAGLLGLALLIAIGTLNKHTTALYTALLSLSFFWEARDRRRYLLRVAALAAISLILVSPHILWQIREGWPTLEFQHNARLFKNEALSIPALVGELILHHHPLSTLLWFPGLYVLLTKTRWRPYRGFAWTFLAFCALLIPAHGKSYYAVGLMAPLLAVGALEWDAWGSRKGWILPPVLGLSGLVLMPLTLPLLSVAHYQAYEETLGLRPSVGEKHEEGTLPQHYADMFGWKELAETVATVFHQLPAVEQPVTAIYAQNYGQAGALDYYGPALGLPEASSGHNNFYLWGFHPRTATQVLIVGGEREDHEKVCGRVQTLATFDHPLRMPYERHLNLYLCQDLKKPLDAIWPQTRHYI